MNESIREAVEKVKLCTENVKIAEEDVYKDIDKDSKRAKRMRKKASTVVRNIWNDGNEKMDEKISHLLQKQHKAIKINMIDEIIQITEITDQNYDQNDNSDEVDDDIDDINIEVDDKNEVIHDKYEVDDYKI